MSSAAEKQRLATARNFWAEANEKQQQTNGTATTTTKKTSTTPSKNAKPTSTSTKPTAKPSATTSPKPAGSTSPAKPQNKGNASPHTRSASSTSVSAGSSSDESKKPGFFSTFTSKVRSMTTFSKEEPRQASSSTSTAPKEMEISAPQRVVHSGHVGFGANGLQLSGHSVPPELRILMARLDEKLAQMGATQLTPEEQDAVLRRMLAAPRTTVKPGTIAKPTVSTSPSSSPPSTPAPTPGNISTPTLVNSTSRNAIRGPTANTINTESLKMLTALLKERDDRIRELEAALRDAKQTPSGEVTKFAEEKRLLMQQKRDLEQQLAQLKTKQTTAARSTIAPNEINKLVEERVKVVQSQSSREIDSLKARLTALEKERDELVGAKAKLEVEIQRSKTTSIRAVATPSSDQANASMAAEVKKLESQLDELKSKLKSTETEREQIEASRRSLQAQVDSLQSQLTARDTKTADAEAAAFQAKLSELTASHSKTQETLRAENQTQREQLVKIQQQLKDAELALQSAKVAESSSGSEMASFKNLMQKELDLARSQSAEVDRAKAVVEKAKDALQTQVTELAAALEAEKAKNARESESHSKLTERINDLESTLSKRTKENQAVLDTTKAQLTAAQAETSKLRSQLDSAVSSAATSAELASLEEQLNSAMASAKQAEARLATANSDKDRVAKTNAELEARVRQLTEDLQTVQLQQTGADLSAELTALEKELQTERSAKNKLEDDKDALEATLLKLNQQMAGSNNVQRDTENQLRQANKELEVLRAQLTALADSASQLQNSGSGSGNPSHPSGLGVGLGSAPPAPAPPPPMAMASPMSQRAATGGMNQSLLDSIKNPDVVLKRTSQILHLPPEVTDGDDILSALARRIIDRRDRMKGAPNELDELDEDDW